MWNAGWHKLDIKHKPVIFSNVNSTITPTLKTEGAEERKKKSENMFFVRVSNALLTHGEMITILLPNYTYSKPVFRK